MLRIFFFLIFVSAVILFFGLVQILLLRQLNRPWWQKKWIRRASYSLPVIGVVFLITYSLAEYYKVSWLSQAAAPIAVTAVVMEIALMFSLPFSGIIHLINRWLDRIFRSATGRTDRPSDPRRRSLLKGAAAALPLAAVATGFGGVGRAYAGAEVRHLKFDFTDLPPALDGFRIMQISDAHLRHYVTVDDLEPILKGATAFEPDLVVVTGDLADDLKQLPIALDMIASLDAPHGAYAILGNHEYFRGVTQVRRIFDRSPIPLLIDQHVRLNVGESMLCLGGLDDPRSMRDIPADFFDAAIAKTFVDAGDYDFSILMSHRPDAFPEAARRGINLTFAGHTHGAQVGFGGRSILETSFPHAYLWGRYHLDRSQLYTTSGTGHWFPFRLGCPAEVPVIELRRV